MTINPTDFHSYAFSDYLDNVVRGAFGEYLVALALGVTNQQPLSSWESWDIDYDQLKIEVKTSAYWQTWKQKRATKPVFGIPKKRGWISETNEWDNKLDRQADVYIFCLYHETDEQKARQNVLNTDFWKFYVVPTSGLPDQKTISLSSLERLTSTIPFTELKSRVDSIENPCTPRAAWL